MQAPVCIVQVGAFAWRFNNPSLDCVSILLPQAYLLVIDID